MKFLDLTGFQYFVTKVIGKTSISGIGDGTLTGAVSTHTNNKSNPHSVTKAQVGLSNVPNVATNDQTPSYTAATTLTALTSGEKLSVAFGKLSKAVSSLISHLADKSNPHGVTPAQIAANTTFGYISNANLLTWALSQTTGGTFMADIAVTGVPAQRYWYGALSMNNGGADRGLIIYNAELMYTITTQSGNFDGMEWMRFANVNEVLLSSGGLLNGYVIFNNLNSFYALQKGRTIENGETHWLTLGVGVDGASVMEHYSGETTSYDDAELDGRLELRSVLSVLEDALMLRDYQNAISYRIFGQHNKPVSTYAGTGEARAVYTKGIGNAVLIFGDNACNALVTPHGAMCFCGGTIQGFGSDSIKFADGTLTIGTANPASAYFNASGIEYRYQVL